MIDHSLNGKHVQHKIFLKSLKEESASLRLAAYSFHASVDPRRKTFSWLNVKPITSEQVPQSALYNVMLES